MRSPGRRDEDWFTRTYTTHYPDIVRYGHRRLADLDGAAELAQEVFVIAWRRRDQVPPHCLPWLYGVARRLLANRWRADRARPRPLPLTDPELLASTTQPADQDGAATLADIRTALATLSDPHQEILRLVGWEELTVGEAAAGVGLHERHRRRPPAPRPPPADRRARRPPHDHHPGRDGPALKGSLWTLSCTRVPSSARPTRRGR